MTEAITAIRRALISVSDKTGLEALARRLTDAGVELISTGGTAKRLREAGFGVRDVSDLTDFPEMMDGRVKTLHPMVHGGILARRDVTEHMEELERGDIPPIDVVVNNLYPFRETIARPDSTLEDALENIDIGGPAMVRAAAKNHAHVAIVVDPSEYGAVVNEVLG